MAFHEYKWNKNTKFMDTVYKYNSYKPNHCDPDLYTSIIGFIIMKMMLFLSFYEDLTKSVRIVKMIFLSLLAIAVVTNIIVVK